MKSLGDTGIKRLNRSWRHRTARPLSVVLCGLSNPYNVGGVLRTAAAFGVDTVYLTGATPGPEHPGVAKTALGTDRALAVHRLAGPKDAVAAARTSGAAVVAVELADTARPVFEPLPAGPLCLVFGSEGHGLPPAVLASCDETRYVPLPGRVASLNVAAAAALAVYECRRQEWTPVAR